MHYPGPAQVGFGAQILRKLPWWRMEPDFTAGMRFVARAPGEAIPAGEAVADKGQWAPPRVPGMDDWLRILEVIR